MVENSFICPHCHMKVYSKECPVNKGEPGSIHTQCLDCPRRLSGAEEAFKSVDELDKLIQRGK
ncbi:MAG: hypothetical protein A2W17_12545 [Planctomycetes bacterium RBG_16_41_13]|nr:MAG: hypothetical protein A2W17_12545 [Planctomycetes bacterium RBG_16_41_13]